MKEILSTGIAVLGLLALLAMPTAAQRDEIPKPGDPGKATVLNDPQNVISRELFGSWVTNKDLTARLAGVQPDKVDVEEVTFRESADASKLICTKLEAMASKVREGKGGATGDLFDASIRSIYLAGEVQFGAGEDALTFPFALVIWRGNPQIMIYRSVRGRDDLESGNIMLVPDPKGDGDLFFIGGDKASERFKAFERKKPTAGEDEQE